MPRRFVILIAMGATLAVLLIAGCGAANSACNGHPCIGNWQREKAKGGAVVKCRDGTWSHAGGLSGACSSHGGEAGWAGFGGGGGFGSGGFGNGGFGNGGFGSGGFGNGNFGSGNFASGSGG